MQSNKKKFYGEGITFDDVLLMPAYSKVQPREVDISTQLTRKIKLNVPIVSAAMDTVTESTTAIAMAQEGGIGILHKNMNIERQADEVRKVKRSESGMIKDPITLQEDATLAEAQMIIKEYKIGGIPIIGNNGKKLVGIITNRDLRFQTNLKLHVADIMTSDNLVTAGEGTTLKKAEKILQKYRIEKLPVVDKKGSLIGLITYKDILKVNSHPVACKDEFGRLLTGAAIGVTLDMIERVAELIKVDVDVICIDTAHGHSQGVIDAIKLVKNKFPRLQIIAGNIATGEGAKALVKAGADAIKVGVGPGSICTTRVIAGAGVPQITAVYEAYQAIKDTKVPIISDGGIRYTGDLVKAIAAGADTIMAGSLFAGVEESPGETIIYEGRKYKLYRGMGSIDAMQEGSKDRYFQDTEDDIKKLVPEGIVGRVPYKGTLAEVIVQYVGGLRAGMGYCGASNIKGLKEAQFIKITQAGVTESHPHDVTITREAPNYSR